MSKPSIMIATPAYGGLITIQYLRSMIDTKDWAEREKISLYVSTMGNESLITRGRNRLVEEFLQSGCDKLLFIDADIGWETNDIWRLYYSDKKIIGGLYPIKGLPPMLNFNALPSHEHYFPGIRKTLPEFAEYKKIANPCGEIEVQHMATGFMMIDRSVFLKLKDKVPRYHQFEHGLNREEYHCDFFQVGVRDGFYESEDWFFCSLARENGISVWAHTEVILTHTGTYTFKGKP